MDRDAAMNQLRAHGLTYPGAHLKSPWENHKDLAVNDKTFAYLSVEGQPFSISCKLSRSLVDARELPYTKPTAYGLGKWGWVTATPGPDDELDMDMFLDWIDESYRAQAKKRQVKELDERAG